MFYLCITIIADVVGVALLGKAKGFNEPWYLVAGLLCMIIGFIAFSFATKSISLSFANAVWSGLSLILVMIAGRIFFGESVSVAQYFCMAMILVGIVGIEVMEKA